MVTPGRRGPLVLVWAPDPVRGLRMVAGGERAAALVSRTPCWRAPPGRACARSDK